MAYKNEHSIRVKQPTGYDKYRRGNLTTGIDAIYGIKGGKSEVQALRFDKSKFTPEEARAWADKHGFKGSLHKAKPKADHDEGGAPAGSAGITVTTALRDVSTQYAEQNEIDDDFGEDLIDLLCEKDFDANELQKGLEHELEHTSDRSLALKFAFDHLEEHPDYYSKLKEAEKTMDHASAVVHSEYEDTLDDNIDGDDEIEFEAFKAGTHVDSEGEENTYTEEQLDKMCAKYNEGAEKDPAPLTLGHPSDNSPAYGWVKSARTFAGKVLIKAHQLNKDFVDAVKNGSYKKVSMSLYDTEDGPRIRHVGFLGATPPAIKGLAAVSFASSTPFKSYTEEFTMATDKGQDCYVDVKELEKENNFFKKLFNMFKIDVTKVSQDFAEEKAPEVKVADHSDSKSIIAMETGDVVDNKEVKEKETKDPGEATSASAEEKEVKAKIANEANEESSENDKLKAEIASLKSECETLKAALAKDHSESAKVSDRLFCESLVKDGKLRPVDLEMTILNLEARSNLDAVRNYSEEQSAAKKYREALMAAPKIVEFGEFPTVPNQTTGVSIPSVGEDFDSYVEKKIKDKLAATPNISYMDAYKTCMSEFAKEAPEKYTEYVKKMLPSR